MNADTILEELNRQKCEGNPIIDIFYESVNRFGPYATYTVCQDNKLMNIHHVLPNTNS
jgi:hypothetical protein